MKMNQFGIPRKGDVKGIVIHNTQNFKMSARELYDWLENESRTSQCCHYLIDHTETIQVMPLDWSVWNTGDGYSFGNLHCIAIEICSNPNTELYLKGEARALALIRELMAEFNLTEKDIYFHRDFQPNINCPAQILKLYGSKANFLAKLKGE